MEKLIFEGKNKEDAIDKCLLELSEKEENLIINIKEENNKLLKKKIKIEVIRYNDLIDYIRTEIKNILNFMGLNVNLEILRKENDLIINMDTNNNSILIGKNGKNLKSLQDIIRQIINEKTNNKVNIYLDINSYKLYRERNIIRLAKKLAKEVSTTKIPIKMSSMNSYERRIIHNLFLNNKFVYTESDGEEPNRYVTIKPKQ